LRRGQSYALREKLDGIVRDPRATTPIADPARARLLEARRAIVEGWNTIASKLEAQGETVVGGHVRYFATHLPPVLTGRGRMAEQFIPGMHRNDCPSLTRKRLSRPQLWGKPITVTRPRRRYSGRFIFRSSAL